MVSGQFRLRVESVRNAEEALALFECKICTIWVITDNRLPGMSGNEMAHIIKLRSPSTPVLMYTGLPPEDQSCLDFVLCKDPRISWFSRMPWRIYFPLRGLHRSRGIIPPTKPLPGHRGSVVFRTTKPPPVTGVV
jgi:hypothetical protein